MQSSDRVELKGLVLRTSVAFAIASVAVLLATGTVFAAMDASLSSDHGRPGDWVLVLTDDHNGAAIYEDLASENNQPIYMWPTSANPAAGCGAGSKVIGRLAWRGNRGGLAFQVPQLPQQGFYLFMETHSQCWRIGGNVAGGLHGPLVFTVGQVPADNQDVAKAWTLDSLGPPQQRATQKPGQQSLWQESAGPWRAVIAAILLVVLALAGVGFWRWRMGKGR